MRFVLFCFGVFFLSAVLASSCHAGVLQRIKQRLQDRPTVKRIVNRTQSGPIRRSGNGACSAGVCSS